MLACVLEASEAMPDVLASGAEVWLKSSSAAAAATSRPETSLVVEVALNILALMPEFVSKSSFAAVECAKAGRTSSAQAGVVTQRRLCRVEETRGRGR